MRPNILFGGISLFFFGDVLQLKPVMGRYIWSQPMNLEYLQAYLVQPHWDRFSIISLEENHRQQGDLLYADILNRIRVGAQTNEDMCILQERVRRGLYIPQKPFFLPPPFRGSHIFSPYVRSGFSQIHFRTSPAPPHEKKIS